MPKHTIPRMFRLADVPEFQRFQEANPGHRIDARQTTVMYGRAIHWLSVLEVLWPDFEQTDNIRVEVAYLVANDPDGRQHDNRLPQAFYVHMVQTLAAFWRMQLEDLYPDGDWSVTVHQDDEMTVDAHVFKRR